MLEPHPPDRYDPILRLQMTHLGVGARAPEIICGELRGVLSMLRIASKQPRRKTRITDRFRSVRAPFKRSRSELRQPSASYDESCDVSDAPRRACARCVPSQYLDQPLVSPKSGSDAGWTRDFTRPSVRPPMLRRPAKGDAIRAVEVLATVWNRDTLGITPSSLGRTSWPRHPRRGRCSPESPRLCFLPRVASV